MDKQVMTKQQAEAYREEYRKAAAKWSGETFQHFETEAQWTQHLSEVEEAREQHKAPF